MYNKKIESESRTGRPKRSIRTLLRDRSGLSIVEFALMLPVILTLGLFGTEIALMSAAKMKVSQIALSLADNASRLGQTDNSAVTPTVTEADVDALLDGAINQGSGIDLEAQGRIILSSLEYEGFNDLQFIHWQRCRGDLDVDSAYGDDGANNGLTGTPLAGMGKGATQITADDGSAVMFVEISYNYEALFENPFGSGDKMFTEEAAFIIRDDRNLRDSDEVGVTGGNSQSPCD